MALTLERVWGATERPWGYEWRVDYRDGDGVIQGHALTFPSLPSKADRDQAVARLQQQLETQPVSAPPADPKDTEIAELTTRVTVLTADKAALQVELALYKPKPAVGEEIV